MSATELYQYENQYTAEILKTHIPERYKIYDTVELTNLLTFFNRSSIQSLYGGNIDAITINLIEIHPSWLSSKPHILSMLENYNYQTIDSKMYRNSILKRHLNNLIDTLLEENVQSANNWSFTEQELTTPVKEYHATTS